MGEGERVTERDESRRVLCAHDSCELGDSENIAFFGGHAWMCVGGGGDDEVEGGWGEGHGTDCGGGAEGV